MSISKEDFYLSYSGRKLYLTCPKQYYFRYVLKDPARSDPKTAMFGSAIGKVFEWFYEHKMWASADPVSLALSKIGQAIQDTFEKENYIIGSDQSYETHLKADLHKFVPLGIDIIRNHRFLTVNSRAEEDLTVIYSNPSSPTSVKMVGRADFVHAFSSKDVWILDGKASKHREKYVDSDQLIWYATQYYLKYHVTPSRLGFIFWCFPDSPVSWIEYDADLMRKLVKKTVEVVDRIFDGDFPATPSGDCHRCPYRSKCDEGTIHLAKKRVESGGRIDNSVFDVERV